MANIVYPSSYHQQSSDKEPSYPAPTNLAIANEALNLSVLQRHLPSTVSIDFRAPYAVIYTCKTSTQAWEKSGIEGSLFVVKLRDGKHAVVVLNRLGLDNFILHIGSAGEVDVTEEYIILPGNGAETLVGDGDADEKKAYGLWIFEEEQGSTKGVREACAKCIVECAGKTGKRRGVGVTARALGGPDLMALLNPSRRQGSK